MSRFLLTACCMLIRDSRLSVYMIILSSSFHSRKATKIAMSSALRMAFFPVSLMCIVLPFEVKKTPAPALSSSPRLSDPSVYTSSGVAIFSGGRTRSRPARASAAQMMNRSVRLSACGGHVAAPPSRHGRRARGRMKRGSRSSRSDKTG